MKRGGFVLIFLVLSSFFLGGVAAAQEDPYLPSVSPNVEVSNEGVSAQESVSSSTPSGALAFTGGDIVGMVVIAGVLIAGGSVLVASRRRATVTA